MPLKYDIFGAIDKEPPQLTTARSILGVGRDTNTENIKKVYRKLALEWHPDKHYGKSSEEDANQKMGLYSSAYKLLTDSSKRKEAEQAFLEALRQPFLVGNRVFCLGSLYGHRIYIPHGNTAITDASRLITGENSGQTYDIPKKHYVIEGIRNSILSSELEDLLYTFYSGSNTNELKLGFFNKDYGGLDDLPWIIENDRAVDHFLNRRFKQAAYRMQQADSKCPGNVIFMFRHGVCLEAFAAENRSKKLEWKGLVENSIGLYEGALSLLSGKKIWEKTNYMGEKERC